MQKIAHVPGVMKRGARGMRSRGESARSNGGKATSGASTAARRPRIGNLLAETRRRRILDWLQEEGSARVSALSEAFSVSKSTIRRDLKRLESESYIVREHGGAFLVTMPQQVQALALHHLVNMAPSAPSAGSPRRLSATARRSFSMPARRPRKWREI